MTHKPTTIENFHEELERLTRYAHQNDLEYTYEYLQMAGASARREKKHSANDTWTFPAVAKPSRLH